MTITISLIAVRLIWVPVIQVLVEVNEITGNIILYIIKKSKLGNKIFLVECANFLKSGGALSVTSLLFSIFFLYYVANEILLFIGCIISSLLPDDLLPTKKL